MDEKIIIDLSDKTLNEYLSSYGEFANNVQRMLLDLSRAGLPVPATIRGTQQQIDAFFRALKGEKRYMDAYNRYGLGDSRTMMNKRDLDRAVSGFEGETGLRWPFKN
jgi:hypothetical protein